MGSFGELTGCEPATFGFRNDNNAKDSDITNGELNSFLTKKLFFKARRAQRELKSE
jgi:hypothetical protein